MSGIETIRRLAETDASSYRHLLLEALAAVPTAFTSSVEERLGLPADWWQARLAAGGTERVIGAFAASELVGIAGLRLDRRERTRHKATLFGMYVRPALRGRGLASALVAEVLAQARATPGVELVQLTVTASNRTAIALYERCGFERFGSEPMAVKFGSAYLDKLHIWRRIDSA